MVAFKNFATNVFVNCPFDDAYLELQQTLLFTIRYFGFQPKIASQVSDSAQQRIDKICELISSSKFSIHDLSRLRASKKRELARQNMPFELGIDYGGRRFAGSHFEEKRFLVLEKDPYEYSKALSDLGGVDIKSHDNNPATLIRVVRDWFIETVGLRNLKPASVVFNDFNFFLSDFDGKRRAEGFDDDDIYKMRPAEFLHFIDEWLTTRRSASSAR